MIRTVLVDDEEKSRRALSTLLGRYCPDVEIIGSAGSMTQAVEVIDDTKPQLVFMDILMPDGTGFEVLERCRNKSFNVIFVTAFEEHALRAFRFSALHYILKPVNFLELQIAVQRFQQSPAKEQDERIKLARQTFVTPLPENIVLPSADGFLVVKVAEIVRCEADSNYTKFIFVNGRSFLASRSLAHFEDLLAGLHFIRIHHKHLVSLIHIRQYTKGRGGYVQMADGNEVEVSARKKDEFLAAMAIFARGA